MASQYGKTRLEMKKGIAGFHPAPKVESPQTHLSTMFSDMHQEQVRRAKGSLRIIGTAEMVTQVWPVTKDKRPGHIGAFVRGHRNPHIIPETPRQILEIPVLEIVISDRCSPRHGGAIEPDEAWQFAGIINIYLNAFSPGDFEVFPTGPGKTVPDFSACKIDDHGF
jgi:hypothetical protein